MRKLLCIYFIFLFRLAYCQGESQSILFSKIAQLEKSSNSNRDTTLAICYFKLAKIYNFNNPDSSLYFLNKSLNIYRNIDNIFSVVLLNYYIAKIHFGKSNFEKSKTLLDTVISIVSEQPIKIKTNKNWSDIATESNILLANSWSKLGNFDKSSSILFNLLKEKNIKDQQKIEIYSQLGNNYFILQDFIRSKNNYQLAGNIANKILDSVLIIGTTVNMANVLSTQGKDKEAINLYLGALKIVPKKNSAYYEQKIVSNLAVSYHDLNLLDSAEKYYFKSLQLNYKNQNNESAVLDLANIGDLFLQLKRYKESEQYLLKAYRISDSLNLIQYLETITFNIHQLYETTNRYVEALKYYKLSISSRDQLVNIDNQKIIMEKEMKHEFEKKQIADSLMIVEERKVNQLKLDTEKKQRYFLYTGLFLVLAFGAFMFNRFRATQKQKLVIELQKQEVEKQKHLVDIKQKEILDSIHYAKRIQQALLPTSNYLNNKIKS